MNMYKKAMYDIIVVLHVCIELVEYLTWTDLVHTLQGWAIRLDDVKTYNGEYHVEMKKRVWHYRFETEEA